MASTLLRHRSDVGYRRSLTALPLDQWTSASYTGLWNYLDYPAIVITVDRVQESDLADDPSNPRYGSEDARMYGLCMYSSLIPLIEVF